MQRKSLSAAVAFSLVVSAAPFCHAQVASDSQLIGLPPFYDFGGPGNSIAAQDSDPFPGSDVNCIGDFFSFFAQLSQGVGQAPGFDPHTTPENLSLLATIAAFVGNDLNPNCEVAFPR